MPASDIVIKGAREHNLRNIDLVLPRNQLICLTGVSGSGKSSLAFDTLYAEGQRRYVESLSSFARQFLGQMPKPDVDLIAGLSPSISISQKSAGKNPRRIGNESNGIEGVPPAKAVAFLAHALWAIKAKQLRRGRFEADAAMVAKRSQSKARCRYGSHPLDPGVLVDSKNSAW